MHGNYRGNYPVITDTVKILSTMAEMVQILKVVITDTVKILSIIMMVEMVEILKCPIEENIKEIKTSVSGRGGERSGNCPFHYIALREAMIMMIKACQSAQFDHNTQLPDSAHIIGHLHFAFIVGISL